MIQQAEAREKQHDAELTAALAAIAAQKRAVQTPQQAAKAIPSVLPPLPLPVSIDFPPLLILRGAGRDTAGHDSGSASRPQAAL